MNDDCPMLLKNIQDSAAAITKLEQARSYFHCKVDSVSSLKQQVKNLELEIDTICKTSKYPLYILKSITSRILTKKKKLERQIKAFENIELITQFENDVAIAQKMLTHAAGVKKKNDQDTIFTETTSIQSLKRKSTNDGQDQIVKKSRTSRNSSSSRVMVINPTDGLRVIKRLHLFEDLEMKNSDINLRQINCNICNLALNYDYTTSKIICRQCAYTRDFVDTNVASMSSVTDSDSETSVYERYTHFLEKLEPFRPKKYVQIPDQVFHDIKFFRRQTRFDVHKEWNFTTVAAYLKHLGYNDLYEFKYQLLMQITGIQWPIMSQQQEYFVMFVFLLLQSGFESIKHRKSIFNTKIPRTSFLKYDFSLYHEMLILDYPQFLPRLQKLLVPSRLLSQLRELMAICKHLKIDYVPGL